MENKGLLVVMVLLVLLVGGYGAYRIYHHFARFSAPPSTSTTMTDPNSNSTSSLKDLITKSAAQQCSFTTRGSNGMVYVTGGKVRGDFEVTTNNQTTKSHMIVMDNTSYIWTEGQKTGFKMSFDPSATPPTTTGSTGSTAPNGGFDPTANNNYKCTAWVADATMFALPTGVTFSTFAMPSTQKAPQQGSSTSGSSASSQCSYCDSLTGDSKTQCLTALNCK